MRIIGLDVGDKTIGVAVSDELGTIGQGVALIRRGAPEEDLAALRELEAKYDAAAWVVGLPRSMNGRIGPQAEKVLAFVEMLRGATERPVETWDERLTTKAAERSLIEADLSRRRRKSVIDQTAAALILQGYLDRHRAR